MFSEIREPVEADAVIVLGAEVFEDKPSPVFKERINYAIWLYKNDFVEKIILTGGKTEDQQYAESEVAKEYAIDNNVNSEDIREIDEKKIICFRLFKSIYRFL